VGTVGAKRPIHIEIGPIELEVHDCWWSNDFSKVLFSMSGEHAQELGELVLLALGEEDKHDLHINLGRVKVIIQSVEEGEG
jgi:hypothetical protein